MAAPLHFKPADYGYDVGELGNGAGRLFKPVTIEWSRPRDWNKDERAPVDEEYLEPGYLYAITRNHHRAKTRDTIVYIGITNNLDVRFNNHPKARDFADMRGPTGLSIGAIDFGSYRAAKTSGNRAAIEGLEHILIWTLWPTLFNDSKQMSLPKFKAPIAQAWHLTNIGYRFAGRMPREIVYPWMLIKPGRDRSDK
ncbi:GIY-YIG nuclease family protein [Rhizobium leguminosarum]|uniref:GIY-YIG nuclease family protein n=1 Tax=Rhizobium leguminosarum TaxID=384 RepID=UPI00103C2F35|nr:GIY-YIG nuclease family protein [Rhizobium leguminosarum]TBY71887.1 GIY-YIG nuclease family protein [Rhizobium leguminosarum bv. viciae]